MKRSVTLTINGSARTAEVEPRALLVHVLRDELDLTGTRAHVVKEMAADPVRRIGRLTVTVSVPSGRVASEEDRALLRRTADLCPVKQSLHPATLVDLSLSFGD